MLIIVNSGYTWVIREILATLEENLFTATLVLPDCEALCKDGSIPATHAFYLRDFCPNEAPVVRKGFQMQRLVVRNVTAWRHRSARPLHDITFSRFPQPFLA